jgi:hypothetical protein
MLNSTSVNDCWCFLKIFVFGKRANINGMEGVIFAPDEMQASSISFLEVLIWCYTFLVICFSYNY